MVSPLLVHGLTSTNHDPSSLRRQAMGKTDQGDHEETIMLVMK